MREKKVFLDVIRLLTRIIIVVPSVTGRDSKISDLWMSMLTDKSYEKFHKPVFESEQLIFPFLCCSYASRCAGTKQLRFY